MPPLKHRNVDIENPLGLKGISLEHHWVWLDLQNTFNEDFEFGIWTLSLFPIHREMITTTIGVVFKHIFHHTHRKITFFYLNYHMKYLSKKYLKDIFDIVFLMILEFI